MSASRCAALCLVLVCLSGCLALPEAPELHGSKTGEAWRSIPFAWGFASSSYQYEDPDVTKGTPSWFYTDWDILVSEGGAPEKGNAVYSWSHFEKDLQALRKVGVTHYRFSVSWARVEPKPGEYNEKAFAGYVRMARLLKQNGIEPIVCIWHFTFPEWLYDRKDPGKSNWLHPEFAERWKSYTTKLVRAVAPYARYYAPQNEPNGQISTAYIAGQWPPNQVAAFSNYWKAITSSSDAFRDAAAIIKREDPGALVMSVEALPWWEKSNFDPTGIIWSLVQNQNFDHLDRVYDVCDILGINYYYSKVAGPVSLLSQRIKHGPDYTEMGWQIDPQGLYDQIATVSERYGNMPMMITENGIATLDDEKRIRYLDEHLAMVRKARRDGYPVLGYFVWSLVDNYEWHWGYKAKFGVSHMNPKTYTRELRPSAFWYRDQIEAGIE